MALDRQAVKTIVLASLGSGFEIYDFIIYGVFAREIASQFFPATDPLVGLLSAFSVFAIGYLSRPFGAILLGSLGDRLGRRIIFLISVLAMSGITIGIGLIPSYASIGLLAPILLVALRMIQGVFLAGELPCSIAYVVEEMPSRAGLVSGAVTFCLNIGVLAATLISLLIHAGLSPSEITLYGWRLAFFAGGALGLLGYWLRTSLQESKEFERIKGYAAKRPIHDVLREFPKQLAIGVSVTGIVNTCNILLFVVLPPYFVAGLGYDPVTVSAVQNMGMVIMAVTLISVAWLSDKLPVRYFQRFGTVLILGLSYPFFHGVAAHQIGPVAAFVVIGLTCGLVNGTYAYLLADLYPTRVRFSGVALSLNVSAMIFTALTPLCVTILLGKLGVKEAPGIVLSVVALVAVTAGFGLRRAGGQIALAGAVEADRGGV